MPLMLPISHPGSALTLEEERGFSVSIDYSLNIVLSSSALSIPITPTKDGQFGRTYTDVYVDTNNAAGYTLTLQSNTDTLSNEKLNKTIDPLPSPITCTDESDDSCDNFPSGKWGYRIGSTGAYLPATGIVNSPVRLAHTNTVTTNTNPVATLYFGTKIDADTPTGIYDGVELTFIATANIQKYNVTLLPTTGISSIQLDDNGPCTDAAGCIYALEKDSEHTLVANMADGYEFTSWTNSTEYGTFSDAVSATTTFTVGEGDAEISASGEKKSILVGCTSAEPCMQNTSAITCDATVRTVTDGRDGTKYQIKKFGDKCWMVNNLSLTNPTVDLDSSNTNIASTKTITASEFKGWAVDAATNTYTEPKYLTVTSSLATDKRSTDSTNSQPYGVLYDYCAASARTYCYAINTGPTSDKNNGESSMGTGATAAQRAIAGDICPAGWRLPTGGSGGELQALSTALGGTSSTAATNFRKTVESGGFGMPLSGNFLGSMSSQGTTGFLWSSSRNNDNNMNLLYYFTSSVNPTGNGNRGNGFSIRCVLE